MVEVTVEPGALKWEQVLTPGRGIVYNALDAHVPELGRQIHDRGFGPYRLRPFGFGPPFFPTAERRAKTYAVGGDGRLGFASPLVACTEAIVKRLKGEQVLRWGPLPLEVRSVHVVSPPRFLAGEAEFRAGTPIVVKGPARGTFLLPEDPEWLERLRDNLRRKAATLGLDDGIGVALVDAGSRRLFRVDGSARIGASATVRVAAAPETLQAVWSWGLGQGNAAGFGWIAS